MDWDKVLPQAVLNGSVDDVDDAGTEYSFDPAYEFEAQQWFDLSNPDAVDHYANERWFSQSHPAHEKPPAKTEDVASKLKRRRRSSLSSALRRASFNKGGSLLASGGARQSLRDTQDAVAEPANSALQPAITKPFQQKRSSLLLGQTHGGSFGSDTQRLATSGTVTTSKPPALRPALFAGKRRQQPSQQQQVSAIPSKGVMFDPRKGKAVVSLTKHKVENPSTPDGTSSSKDTPTTPLSSQLLRTKSRIIRDKLPDSNDGNDSDVDMIDAELRAETGEVKADHASTRKNDMDTDVVALLQQHNSRIRRRGSCAMAVDASSAQGDQEAPSPKRSCRQRERRPSGAGSLLLSRRMSTDKGSLGSAGLGRIGRRGSLRSAVTASNTARVAGRDLGRRHHQGTLTTGHASSRHQVQPSTNRASQVHPASKGVNKEDDELTAMLKQHNQRVVDKASLYDLNGRRVARKGSTRQPIQFCAAGQAST